MLYLLSAVSRYIGLLYIDSSDFVEGKDFIMLWLLTFPVLALLMTTFKLTNIQLSVGVSLRIDLKCFTVVFKQTKSILTSI